VSAAAIGVKDYGCRSVELGGVLRPPIFTNFNRESWHTAEALLEQQATGAKLVFTGSVTGFAGEQDDLLVSRRGTHV
jgi:hypothetical protein